MARRYRRREKLPFGGQVLVASGFFGLIVFNMAPQLQQAFTGSRAMLDQIEATERSAYYPNCSAARAAGAAPIHRGSPGYRSEMDGDGDGIACEPYH